jgi:hypothetical protein
MLAAWPRPRTPHGGDLAPPFQVVCCEKDHYVKGTERD